MTININNNFKFNKIRREQMMGLIDKLADLAGENFKDKGMKEMYLADRSDAEYILECLEKGDIQSAIRTYKNCDTAARDEYPQWVAELAGYKIFRPSKTTSMEATE